MVASFGISARFTAKSDVVFVLTKTVFKKLEYRFLVESTKIESATFPYKTAVSEANEC